MAVLLTILLSNLLMITALSDDMFDQYEWKNRIIVIYARAASTPEYKQQLEMIDESSKEFAERDLIGFHIFDNHGVGPNGKILKPAEVGYIKDLFHFRDSSFGFVLIGKDGTVKHRKSEPVSEEELYAIIDAMPMRRREMKKD